MYRRQRTTKGADGSSSKEGKSERKDKIDGDPATTTRLRPLRRRNIEMEPENKGCRQGMDAENKGCFGKARISSLVPKGCARYHVCT